MVLRPLAAEDLFYLFLIQQKLLEGNIFTAPNTVPKYLWKVSSGNCFNETSSYEVTYHLLRFSINHANRRVQSTDHHNNIQSVLLLVICGIYSPCWTWNNG
jgi:hypothetical protein